MNGRTFRFKYISSCISYSFLGTSVQIHASLNYEKCFSSFAAETWITIRHPGCFCTTIKVPLAIKTAKCYKLIYNEILFKFSWVWLAWHQEMIISYYDNLSAPLVSDVIGTDLLAQFCDAQHVVSQDAATYLPVWHFPMFTSSALLLCTIMHQYSYICTCYRAKY